MAYSYMELKKKTVAQLREIAKGTEHEAVKGYSQLNKEHLLVGLCKALGIDHRVHHVAAGIDKAKIKAQIKQAKADRDALLSNPDKDHHKLIVARAKIHRLKRVLRKAMM